MRITAERQIDLTLENQAKIIVKSHSYERIMKLRAQMERNYPGAKVLVDATDQDRHSGHYYFAILIED